MQNTFTDNVTIDDLVTLAQSFGTLDPSRVTFFTLPTVPSESDPDALDVDEDKAPAVFDALLNDQPLPGEPAAEPRPPAPRRHPRADPAERVDERHDGRPGHRPGHPECQRPDRCGHRGDGQLNDVGFAVTEDDLLAPEGTTQTASPSSTTRPTWLRR